MKTKIIIIANDPEDQHIADQLATCVNHFRGATKMIEEHLYAADEKLKIWGDGEWINECDEVTFEHEGFQCKIIREAPKRPYAESFCMFGGFLNGYIEIPINHPYYHMKYKDMNIDVHGGLIFGDYEDCISRGWDGHWIGFNCFHSGDLVPWMNQFNIRNIFTPSYKNIDYCLEECKSMAHQLKLLYNTYSI